eukprot:COSAG04_NODE_26564_length_293_cov_0.886598_1_plen_42_part_10
MLVCGAAGFSLTNGRPRHTKTVAGRLMAEQPMEAPAPKAAPQ